MTGGIPKYKKKKKKKKIWSTMLTNGVISRNKKIKHDDMCTGGDK